MSLLILIFRSNMHSISHEFRFEYVFYLCMPKVSTKELETKKEEAPEGEFGIVNLFGSKTRVRLLSLFLDNADRCFYVRELTRKIDAQLNSVRRELTNLVGLGIVLEVEGTIVPGEKMVAKKKTDKKKYYRANDQFTFFAELRSIMKKSVLMMNKVLVADLEAVGTLDLLLLTGRFLDQDESPTDVLIVGDIAAGPLKKAIGEFEKRIGHEVNYTLMPREEFLYRRDVKDRFLLSCLNVDKVAVVNNFPDGQYL